MWSNVRGFEKIFLASRWVTEIFLLGLFWMIVLPSYMRSNFLVDGQVSYIIREIINVCTRPSIDDMTRRLATITVMNLIFNIFVRFGKLRARSYHIMSIITGSLVVHTNSYPRNLVLIIGFIFITWLLLKRMQYIVTTRSGIIRPVYSVSTILVAILIIGELFFPGRQNWQECRFVMIIMSMKIISLSFDDYHLASVTTYEFFGYLLCPATVLYGPWIKIQEYRLYNVTHSKLNWKWAVKIVQIFTYGMICMILSNCLNQMLLVENQSPPCKWHEAFRNAFVFRAGNYFVCYMAELTMLTAGFNYIHGNPSGRWQYSICRPFSVEFPRSIAAVVRNWNIPAHRFLKGNVYGPHANVTKTFAVVFTFVASLLFHGLNVRITAIVLSLVMLSLSQQIIQDKLAARLSSCCKVTACRPSCDHKYGFYHPITLLVNGVNLLFNLMHLAYLGYVMKENFESKGWHDLYHVWEHDLGLLSHHIILVWFATMLIIA